MSTEPKATDKPTTDKPQAEKKPKEAKPKDDKPKDDKPKDDKPKEPKKPKEGKEKAEGGKDKAEGGKDKAEGGKKADASSSSSGKKSDKDKAASTSDANKNPMRQIKIEKVCLNICTGEAGDALTKASSVLQQLTGQKPRLAKARMTVRTFGIRRDQKIATHVTVRGEKALEILKRGLRVKEFELRDNNFSQAGNFGFGITEHIDLGLKYDPSIGIFGMDFYVVLSRAGGRVARRKRQTSKVGKGHLVTKDEAMKWFVNQFSGTVF
jgi:large subunit ribosomal protein L11e